jgi:hypothetical protein
VAPQTSRLIIALAAASAAACASAGGGASTAKEPGQPGLSVSVTRRGSFSSYLQSSAGIGGAAKIQVDGRVTVFSTGVDLAKTRVSLNVNLPIFNEQLPWAIAPGACGNGAIAVMAVSKFGTIDLGSTGSGAVEIDLAVALAPREQYHVEIYRSGQTLSDVVACTTLRRVE